MAIVYLESNTTGFGQQLLQASARYDDVYFLVRDRARYAFCAQLHNGIRVIDCDTTSFEAVWEALQRIDAIRLLASTSDACIEMAARAAERLGLPGNPPAAVALCRDKWLMQDTLRPARVAYPTTRVIRTPDDIADLIWPVVVKPRQGTGSIGVRLIDNPQEFRQYAQTDAICQRFVAGIEYSVETFSDAQGHHVLGVTRKTVSDAPHFLELAHVFPAALDAATHTRITDCVRRALDAVGYRFGPAHTELKVDGASVTLIEINARLAGGMIPRLMERAYGWSMTDLYIRSHLTARCQFIVPEPPLHSAVAFIVPEIGRAYAGLDFPADITDSADAGHFATGGVNAGKFDFSDRAGYVIATARTPEEAQRDAHSLRDRTRVLYLEPDAALPDAVTIHSIVYDASPARFGSLLDNLMPIEKAHLIMLRTQHIIDTDRFSMLREALLALEADPRLLDAHRSGRGVYFDYEHYVIARCGRDTGGMIQTARSRNDINSTHLYLVVREAIAKVSAQTLTLIETVARRAEDNLDILLPIYSQYQIAMPGSAAHYLAAQCEILLGTLDTLTALRDRPCASPLGACAGAGTSFATDTADTAALLGFASGPHNSLAAISDKNLAQRAASAFTELSGNLNRIACDLQLWTMRETGIATLPDALYGGSSNMPQKRNPWLLEWLRLAHEQNFGKLITALSSLSHLPTGNSYQASRTALETVVEIAGQLLDMLSVMTYALDGIRFDADAARDVLLNGHASATLAAEALVQQGFTSFRDAHGAVAHALTATAAEIDATPLLLDAARALDEAEHGLQTGTLTDRLAFGAGPGRTPTSAHLQHIGERLHTARREHLAHRARSGAARAALDQRFRTAS
ncbi:lyase family protein [Burkholderia sp. Ax-1719]|uniref:lyase family protein n=1 Tax=Burkholderia sp. Ax-1719 TaxID=2608334 RepID=UPI0014202721|nr:lyase family protein [Burkholderia sp. Ax-1719]NIE65417.1 ATP-grasp domain-containing protein [Burkholderia sp. Ax-1719]